VFGSSGEGAVPRSWPESLDPAGVSPTWEGLLHVAVVAPGSAGVEAATFARSVLTAPT